MLLVHCRVRIVPSEWRAKSVRRRATVVDRRTPILAIGQTGVEAVRSRSDRRSRVPNHRIPAHVFRGRKLRRRQRQTHKIRKDDTETIRNPVQPVHAERTGAGLETATARVGQQHQQRASDIALHAQQDGLNTLNCISITRVHIIIIV